MHRGILILFENLQCSAALYSGLGVRENEQRDSVKGLHREHGSPTADEAAFSGDSSDDASNVTEL